MSASKEIELKSFGDEKLMPIGALSLPDRTERIETILREHESVVVTVNGVPRWRLSNNLYEHVENY